MHKADTSRGARVATGITSRSFEVQPIEFSYRGVDGICLAHRLGLCVRDGDFHCLTSAIRPAENLTLDLGAVQVAMSGKDVERGPAQPFCP